MNFFVLLLMVLLSLLVGSSTRTCHALSTHSINIPSKHTLFDVPVSNNGARCRIIVYKKGLPESEVRVRSPADVGGFRSEAYLAINPQGKVPAIQCHHDKTDDLCLAESDTCARYLCSEYAAVGPSFLPDHPVSNQIARFHDVYLGSIQMCLYKAGPPFGVYGTRKDALREYSKQLYILADMMNDDGGGPYLCGNQVSLADATLFPSIVFVAHMYPKFVDTTTSDDNSFIPERIEAWFHGLKNNDPAFRKVYDEMMGGIRKWDENGRWDNIWLAGKRDSEPETLFDKIIAGDIPATIVKEDDKILAFKDINPAAPAHVLVVPKDRDGLTRLSAATNEHAEILGRLMVAAGEIARDESLGFGDGARIVINDGESAGQEVFHLHVHVLGGRDFAWPPG